MYDCDSTPNTPPKSPSSHERLWTGSQSSTTNGEEASRRVPKLGVLLPTRALLMSDGRPTDLEPVLEMARTAEEAGLDSVWVGDSLTAKPRPEPLTTLAAVAAQTSRVRLGTAVLLAALRHPVSLAQAAGTVDLISGGRLVLGVGVGGAFNDAQRREWWNAGVDPATRASRFEEVVSVAWRLMAGETVTHRGQHFDLEDVSVEPVSPRGAVPVLVACHWRANVDRQFRRAAEFGDGIMSISDYPDEFVQVKERVRSLSLQLGRDAAKMEAAFYVTVNLNDDEEAAAEEADRFLRGYYGINIWGDRWGPYGPAEKAAERIRRYADAGSDTVIVRFASFDQPSQMRFFLEDVVPLVLGERTA